MATNDLLPDVERFIERHGMAESTFGRGAVNDWKFVTSMRRGRRVWPETETRVRAFMSAHEETLSTDPSVVACDRAREMKAARA